MAANYSAIGAEFFISRRLYASSGPQSSNNFLGILQISSSSQRPIERLAGFPNAQLNLSGDRPARSVVIFAQWGFACSKGRLRRKTRRRHSADKLKAGGGGSKGHRYISAIFLCYLE